MPARISRSSIPSTVPQSSSKSNKKRKQRSQNAFAIASHEQPELVKIRQHRLGEVEDDEPRNKRQRLTGDDEDEQDPSEAQRQQHKNVAKGRFDELDVDEGSDSEGNEWKLGQVDNDDDSDLDSDEAFGDSDEERFAGYTFRGSSSGQKAKSRSKGQDTRPVPKGINLNEEEEETDEERDQDNDGLGEDAVDLAQMLDDDLGADSGEDSGEERPKPKSATGLQTESKTLRRRSKSPPESGNFNGFGSSDEDRYGSDSGGRGSKDDSDYSMSEIDSDGDGPETFRQLQDVVSSLHRGGDDAETNQPNINQPPDRAKLLAALQSMPNLDPALNRSLRKLTRPADSSKSGSSEGVVKVPLPKRQQDRINRSAAYQKAKETLNRWVDTVKHNRRAEHLHFPLQDPQAQEARGTSRLLPTRSQKPRNELEDTIQNIMRESGMGDRDAIPEEDQMLAAEGLETNKMPIEEVEARRAELRKARDLLFREEKRAKRIKKIKSKAYRRVHRKEKEKAAQQERDLLAAAGLDLSEDEKERNDRRRAEERMGAKHRESRWAKGIKQSGRTIWDDEARSGVTDMAKRNEELRRRMDGERIRQESDSGSVASSDDSDDEDEGIDFKLREQVDQAEQPGPGNSSSLGSLKFMQRADAARKQQNDDELAHIRRELDGEDSPSESDSEINPGRKIFGPSERSAAQKPQAEVRNELEEGFSSDSDNDDAEQTLEDADEERRAGTAETTQRISDNIVLGRGTKGKLLPKSQVKAFEENFPTNSINGASAKTTGIIEGTAPSNASSWTVVPSTDVASEGASDHESEANEAAASEPFIPSNSELVAAAFGGAEVEDEFQREKKDAEESEDDKVIDNTLPGWGSWTGDGISKREKKQAAQKRQQGRFQTREAGIKPSNRRDAKLDKAIISEKRVKKNTKYLANALPHPFESRQQYERALRMPVGPEWTTKETFQNATTPRVMVKQGIVKPMRKPMV